MKDNQGSYPMPARLYWLFISFVFTGLPVRSPATADDAISFVKSVAPLLQSKCVTCHDAELAEADYRLDTYKHLIRLDDGSPAVIGEQPDKSKLFQVLIHEDENLRMPSESDPLPDASIKLIRQWIQEGAAFDGESQDQQLSTLLPTKKHPQPPGKYPAAIPLSAMAFHPSQSQLLVSGYHEITIWNLNGELVQRITDQGERTYSLDLHPRLPQLLTASGTPGIIGEVRTFDLSTGKLTSVLVTTDEVIMDARYSPDGKTIAVAMPDGSTRLIDSETGKGKMELLGHSDQVSSLSWNSDGQRLATASRDHTAKVFDCQSGSSVATFTGHTKPVNDVAFLNSDQAVSVSNDGTAQIWNVRDGKRIREMARNKTPILTIAIAPKKIAISGALATQWFKRDGSQPIEQFNDSDAWTTITAFDETGATFASGTQSGEVVVRKSESEPTRFDAIPGR
jgi:WD40 repeat protein